jgi:hypothetical protein
VACSITCFHCKHDFDPYVTGEFGICPECECNSYLGTKSLEVRKQEDYERFLEASSKVDWNDPRYRSDGYDGSGR